MRVLGYFAGTVLLLTSCNTEHVSTRVFVSYPASQAIEQIDVADHKVLRRTTVGMLPHNMLMDPQADRLYVVIVGSQAVAEIEASTGELLRTFPTEATPMARDDGSAIQAHIDQKAATHSTCFDCHHGGENGAAPSIVGARPFGIAASADNQTLYVANGLTASLAVIGVATGQVKQIVPLPPTGSAHEPTALIRLGDFLYVTLRPTLPSSDPSVVRKIDLNTWAVVAETSTGANAGVLAANMTEDEVYVSNSETNTVTRLNSTTGHLGNYLVGPGPLGLLATPDGTELITANYYNNSLSIIDLASGQLTTYPLTYSEKNYSNPTQISLNEDGTTAYVVSGGTNGYLLTFDLGTRRFTDAMPIGGLPFGVTTANLN